MDDSKKIFVVDDHPVMRLGYRYLLNRDDEMQVCGEAGSVADALPEIERTDPDLVIADISLGGVSGIELVKHLRQERPEILTVVVSMHDEALFAERALRAGARAYIMKNEVDAELLTAIRTVLDGGFFLSKKMNSQILSGFARASKGGAIAGLEQLTDREIQVFELQGRGHTTREIGDLLHISPKTVETYRGRIKRKLQIESTTALTHRAMEWLQSSEHGDY